MSILSASSEAPVANDAKNNIGYQNWQQYHLNASTEIADEQSPVNVGSFVLNKPQSEVILDDLQHRWGGILQDTVAADAFTDYALNGLKDKLIFNRDSFDFQQWLIDRRTTAARQLLTGTADYLTDYTLNRGEDNARRLNFIRNIDWDYRSSLGERKWQAGVSALGAVRETDDEALVWQLRGYAAEQKSTGANAGLIYRRAVRDDVLLGSNLFLDYEEHGDYDEEFFRGSFGLELRSAQIDLYSNRYWAITDPQATDDGEYIYSKDGYDVELAIRPYKDVDISGGVTYYKWLGEFGDADESGLLYNLRFQPLSSSLPGIDIELQLGKSYSADLDWGAQISYTYKIGTPTNKGSAFNGLTFDARAHFFDPVRREYSQRIAKSSIGKNDGPGMVSIAAVTGTAFVSSDDSNSESGTVTLIAGTANGGQIFTAVTITVVSGAESTANIIAAGYYTAVMYESSTVTLHDRGRTLELIAGTVSLARAAGSKVPDVIESGGVIIDLGGTELIVGKGGAGEPTVKISIHSGIVFVSITIASELTVTHYDFDATVLLVENYFGGYNYRLANNTITLGCGSAQQRDFGKYYNSAFTGCKGDLLLEGFAAGSQISLNTNGSALTVSAYSVSSSIRFTVSSEPSFLRYWEDRYPFSPAYNGVQATLRIIDGTGGNLLFYNGTEMTVTVAVSASTHIEMNSEGGGNPTATLYLRAGSISVGTVTIGCSSTNNNTSTEAGEGNLTVHAACDGIGLSGGATQVSINSRAGFRMTTTLALAGGNGNYNFVLNQLDGAVGIVSLLNVDASGKVPTLVLYSTVTASATYELQVLPADSVIAEIVGTATITINADVVDALKFSTPTNIPIFRSELDKNINLATVGVVGAVGSVSFVITTITPPALTANLQLGTIVTTGGLEAIISLGAAIASPTDISVVLEARDSSSTLTNTVIITVRDPGALLVSENRNGVIIGDYAVHNSTYRGHLVTVSVSNSGVLSGLAAGTVYSYSDNSGFASVSILASGVDASHVVLDIDDTANVSAGFYTIEIIVNDSHSKTPAVSLALSIEIVAPLSVSPSSAEALVNAANSTVVATVSAVAGKPAYRYSITNVTPATRTGAISIDENSGIISFGGISDLAADEVITVNALVRDVIGDSATYTLSLSVFAAVSSSVDNVSLHHSYTSGFYTVASAAVSGGLPPYSYNILSISSAASAVLTSNFELANGVIRQKVAAPASAAPATVTILLEINDSAGGVAQHSVIAHLTDDALQLSPATVSIRTTDSGIIATATASWNNSAIGTIHHQFGAITPATATSNLSLNSTSGNINLLASLGVAQTISAEIIASSDAILGIAAVTVTQVIEVFTLPVFEVTSNVQAVTVTTYEPVANLITVNASGSNGNFSYGISDPRFTISNNVNDASGIIDLTATVTSPTIIALTVVATDTLFGDSTTLLVSIHVIDPSSLTLDIANARFAHIINILGEVGELIAGGGFVQGGYQFTLTPANSDFEIIHSGGNSAILSLTADISAVGTRTVTVELSDTHTNTTNKLLAITINLVSIFSHSNLPLPSITVRSELDSNQALATIKVIGAVGAVSFVTTAINPPTLAIHLQLGTLAAADGLGAIVSLLASVSVATDISIVIEARNNTGDSFTSSTLTNTVIIAVRDPGALTVSENRNGVIIDDYAVHNSTYRGHLATVSVSNSGALSGLATGEVYSYSHNSPFASINILASGADDSHVVLDIIDSVNVSAGFYTISISVNDSHSKTPAVSLALSIEIVAPLSVSPSSAEALVNAANSVAVATVSAVAGKPAYSYSITVVEPTTRSSAISIDEDSGIISFAGISNLAADEVITVKAVASDAIGDSATYTLSLSVFAAVSGSVENVSLHHSYTLDFYAVSDAAVSGGLPPYRYSTLSINSSSSEVLASNFELANGVIRQTVALQNPATVTILLEVRDNSGGVAEHSVIAHLSDDALQQSAPATVSIRTIDSGIIATVSVGWSNSTIGTIHHEFGAITPAAAASGLSLNSANGNISLTASLGTAQTISAEIIASSDAILGIAAVTVTQVIEIFALPSFEVTSNVQATTRSTASSLFTVNASGSNGDFSYSVSDTRFTINTNVNDANGIADLTVTTIISPTIIALTVIATEALFGDSTTLLVSVHVVDPPALELSIHSARLTHIINAPGEIGELIASGGFVQGGYQFTLTPANNDFEIIQSGGNSATLSLTANISAVGTRTVTVELSDTHANTTNKLLAITINLVSVFSHSNLPLPSITVRSELDSNQALATVEVMGAVGAVSFVTTAINPPTLATNLQLGTLAAADGLGAIVSLLASVASSSDISIVVEARDTTADSFTSSTLTNTVIIAVRNPGALLVSENRNGVIIDDYAVHNSTYRGHLATVTVRNSGVLSGLATGAVYSYSHNSPFASISILASGADDSHVVLDINDSANVSAGFYTISISVNDSHSKTPAVSLALSIEIVAPVSVSPSSAEALVNAANSVAVATVSAVAGKTAYIYSIAGIAPTAISIDEDSGIISFAGISNLAEEVIIVTALVSDAIGDSATYTLSLSVFAAVSGSVENVSLHHSYTLDFYAVSDAAVSGGLPPYRYSTLFISSSSSEVLASNFELANGVIRQTVALQNPATVTILLEVRDNSGGVAEHSVIAHLSDDALESSPTTVSIQTIDSGIIATVSVGWSNSTIGTIYHEFGAITPAAAASGLSLNSANGNISLTASLGTAQTISAEIIASSDAILGIAAITVTQIIEVFTLPVFEVTSNVQATTRSTAPSLFTVNASGSNGDFSYSINGTSDTRFTINANGIADLTVTTIISPTIIALSVIARDTLFGDSATLLVSVHVVDPPALGLDINNARFTHIINAPGEVGELIASGGFVQGGYQFTLTPANSDFEIIHSGGNSATLSLTSNINEVGTRTVTVELSDTHANTTNKLLAITINLVSVFSHSNLPLPSITVRSELDSNQVLATVEVMGAVGNVSFVTIAINPSTLATNLQLGTLAAADGLGAIVSLLAAVSVATDISIVVEARDTTADSFTSSTLTNTVIIAVRDPGALTVSENRNGVIIDDYAVHNSTYRGHLATVSVRNSGALSGLATGEVYSYSHNSPFASISILASGADDSHVVLDINDSANVSAGFYTISISVDDSHSKTPAVSLALSIEIVAPVSVSPSSAEALVNAANSVAVATVSAVAGKTAYIYSIAGIAPTAISIDEDSGIISFAGTSNLTEEVIIVTALVSDAIGDSATYTLSLSVFTAVSGSVENVSLHHSYTLDFYAVSDAAVSGGLPPYRYSTLSINSSSSEVLASNFELANDVIRQTVALQNPATVTILLEVRDNSGGVAEHSVIAHLSDDALESSPTTVSIRTIDSGIIATVSVGWSNSTIGTIHHEFGAITPAAAASGLSLNSANGNISLTASLGTAQTISAEIIASSDAILGIAAVTVTQIIEVFALPSFEVTGNVQATTRSTAPSLFTVNASGSNGDFSYSVSDTRFTINTNINDANGIADLTVTTIISPTIIALSVIARDTLFGDSTTLLVSVHVVDPPALELSIHSARLTHIINTPGEVGELIAGGGFMQGGYQFTLTPANNDFEIIHSGGNSATLSLTANISAVGTRTVTVELSDTHANTTNKLLAITINLVSVFSYSNLPLPSITVRSELDSNQALATVKVMGAVGNVSFVTTAINPPTLAANLQLGTLAAADGLGAFISLGAAVAVSTDINIVIEARDTTADSFTSSTLTNTVIIAVRNPGALTVSENRNGVIIDDYAVHNSTYRGHLATVSVSNSGALSGLATGEVYSYSHNSPFASINILASGADDSHVVLDIIDSVNVSAGFYTISISVDDSHSKTPAVSIALSIEIVAPVSVSPSSAEALVNAANSVAVATVSAVAGKTAYIYSIAGIAPTAISIDEDSGIISFAGISNLAEEVIIVTALVSDAIGDSATYTLSLSVFAAVSGSVENVSLHHSYTLDFYAVSDAAVSGGLPPYRYSTLFISSSSSEVLASNFELANGVIRQTVALQNPATVTILLEVRDNSGGVAEHSVIAHLSDDALESSPTTVSIRTIDSGIIATVSVGWSNSTIGTIHHEFGAITPAAAASGLSLNSANGNISLTASLGTAQTISAEIIASSDAILGIAAVTVTQIIEAFALPSFEVTGNVQATTRSTASSLFTVNASGSNGDFSYSVSDTRFTINTNVNDANGIADLTVTTIISPTIIALSVIARDTLFGDSTTLLVSVHVVDPPALGLDINNARLTHIINTSGEVGELIASGGFVQGGYQFTLTPANNDFEIIQSGGNSATLSLTANISAVGTRTVTVELSDTHANTTNKLLAITINLVSVFSHSNLPLPSITVRSELDSNQALATVEVMGAVGNVSFVTIAINPPTLAANLQLGTLAAADGLGAIVSLLASVSVATDISIVVEARNNTGDSFTSSTLTNTVIIAVRNPGALLVSENRNGVIIDDYAVHNSTYRGHLATVSVRNSGVLSGLATGAVYSYSHNSPFASISILASGADDSHVVLDINDSANVSAGFYTISISVNDSHSKTPAVSLALSIEIVAPVSVSPSSAEALVNAANSAAVATVSAVAGKRAYIYSIAGIAPTAISIGEDSGIISFAGISNLAEEVIIVTALVSDAIGDSATYTLSLSVFAAVSGSVENVSLHHSYTLDFYAVSDAVVSGGLPPYSYSTLSISSSSSEVLASNFELANGVIRQTVALQNPATVTILLEVRDNSGGVAKHSVIAHLSDDALESSPTTVSIRTIDSGIIATVSVGWSNSTIGTIHHEFGAITPATAASGLSLNSANGNISLTASLGTAQTISAEIIASSDAILGIAAITVKQIIEVFTLPVFEVTGNVQATTYFPVTSLFTVNASGSNGDFRYSIINDTRFTISRNINDANGIADLTVTTIISPTTITVSVIAVDELFSDSSTLLVTVDIVNPPALSVSTQLLQTYFLVASIGAVASVTPVAGYVQNGYSIYFAPTTDNDYFALQQDGSAGAIVSLTASVNDIRTLTATIVIADAHPLNAAITQKITVNIVTLFSAELTQWFTTLTVGSQRSFASITLENIAGSISYTFLDDAVGNLTIDDNGVVSITANIASATALIYNIAVTDDVGDFSSTITLGGTLHLEDPSAFTPIDQISVSVNHLVTQVAGERDVVISPVHASGGYIGSTQYQFELINSAVTSVFTLNTISATQAELRVNGTLLASSTHTATIRVRDLTPDNISDAMVTLVVNDTLSVGHLPLYYWLQPQDIGNTINLTTAGGVLPLVSIQATIAPSAASTQLSLTLAGNIIQLIDNGYITNAALSSTLSLSLAVFDSVNSSGSVDKVEIIVIDAVALPPTKRLTAEIGSASGNLYTVAASGGLGSYNYQTISVSPAAMATLITLSSLSSGAANATLSLVGVTLSVETTIQVVVSAADDYTQATQTIDIVVRYKNLTDVSVPGNGRLLVMGGEDKINNNYPQDVWVTDSANVDDWDTLTTSGYPQGLLQAAVFYNGFLYVMGGEDNSGIISDVVWRSADGVSWSSVGIMPDGGRIYHGVVVLNNKMVLLGGLDDFNNPVLRSTWSSIDGIDWQLLAADGLPPFDHEFAYAVMNNTIYAAGGYNNANKAGNRHLWSSSDGANWNLHENTFSVANAPTAYGGNFAVVFNGTLFIMDTLDNGDHTRKVRYSSTPTDADSWTSYAHSIEQRSDAEVVVYKDKILVMAGETSASTPTPLPNIWASASGEQGSWDEIHADATWLGRRAPVAIVLGDELLPEQIPLLEASFVSVSAVAFSLTVAADGLSASITVFAEYTGVLASISVSGGYLGGGDYEFTLLDDEQLFQIGTNREISISASSFNTVTTVGITVVVDDQYADNATKTLALAVEILPYTPLSASIRADLAYWLTPPTVNATATIMVANGRTPYTAALGNISPADAAKFSLSVSGATIYLIDQTFAGDGVAGDTFTVSLLINDAVTSVTIAQSLQLVEQLSLVSRANITVFTGPLGDVSINIHTVAASGGLGNYSYQIVSIDALFSSYLTLVTEGNTAYLSLTLTTYLLDLDTAGEIIIAVTDERQIQVKQTISIETIDKILTEPGVSGKGKILVFGGSNSGDIGLQDVWTSNNITDWEKITTNGAPSRFINQGAVSFNGYIYAMGGFASPPVTTSDEVWRTADGVNWEKIGTLPVKRNSPMIAVLDKKMILFGGSGDLINSTWSSIDGINWDPLGNNFPLVSFTHDANSELNGTIYIAGDGRHLWSSDDGARWTKHSNIFDVDFAARSRALTYKGTLFLIDNEPSINSKLVRYSSTPTVKSSWNTYRISYAPNRAEFIVHEDSLLIVGGYYDTRSNGSDIWQSIGGAEGSWQDLTLTTSNGWQGRFGHNAIVLDEPTPAQVPRIEATFVSLTASALSIAISADGLSATVTINVAHVGVLASIRLAGGHLGGGDYQFSTSGDVTVLQVGADGQISIVEQKVSKSTQVFELTVVVDDQYADNATDTKTLALQVEISPQFSARLGADTVYWETSPTVNVTATIMVTDGAPPYTVAFSNISAAESAKFSLSLSEVGGTIYLIDKTFAADGVAGDTFTVSILINDAVTSVTIAQPLQLVEPLRLVNTANITVLTGPLGNVSINIHTIAASGGLGNYSYQIVSIDASLSSYLILVTEGNTAYLSLTAHLPDVDASEIIIAATDERLVQVKQTLSIAVDYKSFTEPGVSGSGKILIFGGRLANSLFNNSTNPLGLRDVWMSDSVVNWEKITDFGASRSIYQGVVSFNGYVYAMGGSQAAPSGSRVSYLDEVWRTANGKNWERIGKLPDGARSDPTIVVFDKKMILFGGLGNFDKTSTWSSIDGINWQLLGNAFPGFSFASDSSAVLNGTIYVTGGYNAEDTRDLWSSGDGANWTAHLDMFDKRQEQSGALTYRGTLFLIDNGTGLSTPKLVRYSSTPTVKSSWNSYSASYLPNNAEHIVYRDNLLILGGSVYDGGRKNSDIWQSVGGIEGSWEDLTATHNGWHGRLGQMVVVLDEEPTEAQVPRIEATFVSITLAAPASASADGLSVTFTVSAGYVGAVASLSVRGGYLADGDYQISASGDVAVLQLGENRQISIISEQNLNDIGVQTLQLTLVIDDQYAYNETETQTLVLALEVLPPPLIVNFSGPAEVTVLTGELGDTNVNFYTLTAQVSRGSGNYNYQFSTPDSYLLPYITMVVDGDSIYLSLTALLLDEGVGEVVIAIDDGLSQAMMMTVNVIGRYKSFTDDSVSARGKLLVFGGNANERDVWAVDGDDLGSSHWDELTANGYPVGAGQKAVYYNGNIYVAGGTTDSQAMWRSADGVSWTKSELPNPRVNHALVVLNNKMLLFGGSPTGFFGAAAYTDSWSSTDGITWDPLTADGVPTFPYGPVYAVLNNTLYAIGGRVNSGDNNDLWSTTDGITWTRHGDRLNHNVSGRLNRSMVAFKNTLFIVEGQDDAFSSESKRVHYSSSPTSGNKWISYDNTAVDSLKLAQILVYREQILIIGGRATEGSGKKLGDIWASSSGLPGSWDKVELESGLDFLKREDHVAVVLGDTPTPAQVPLIEAAIVSASTAAIAIAADGLAATVTVSAGYVGVVASLAIMGGYLADGDYQISTSGDDTVLQLGTDRQISIVSGQNIAGSNVQTFQLTLVIDDQYVDNPADTKTLVLTVEVLPPDG